jgi:hypothetical protein
VVALALASATAPWGSSAAATRRSSLSSVVETLWVGGMPITTLSLSYPFPATNKGLPEAMTPLYGAEWCHFLSSFLAQPLATHNTAPVAETVSVQGTTASEQWLRQHLCSYPVLRRSILVEKEPMALPSTFPRSFVQRGQAAPVLSHLQTTAAIGPSLAALAKRVGAMPRERMSAIAGEDWPEAREALLSLASAYGRT